MTYQEIVQAVQHLTLQERLALLEELARSVRGDLAASQTAAPLSERLYGILRQVDPAPSEEILRDDYADYLLKKYA